MGSLAREATSTSSMDGYYRVKQALGSQVRDDVLPSSMADQLRASQVLGIQAHEDATHFQWLAFTRQGRPWGASLM